MITQVIAFAKQAVRGGAGLVGFARGDKQSAMARHAVAEAIGAKPKTRAKNDVSDRDVVVLGSGNLGLVYLMDLRRRLTLEEIDERHPKLIPGLRTHSHIGWLLVRSAEHLYDGSKGSTRGFEHPASRFLLGVREGRGGPAVAVPA